MNVLVHYNRFQSKAYGLWWVAEDGSAKSLYIDPESPQAARGRAIMANKDQDYPYTQFFELLTQRQPYFEYWLLYESDGLTPQEMFESLRDRFAA